MPAMLGRTLVESVVTGRGDLRVYVSRDGGRAWSLASALRTGADTSCPGSIATSFPARPASRPGRVGRVGWVGWAADFRHHHVVVYRTTDQGRRWTARTLSAPAPADVCGPDQIQALSASRAWLVTQGRGNQAWIYATTDGGRSWRRIDPAARAAG
jgi:photosystem II stability/assembly factor-like uncharacterized protein